MPTSKLRIKAEKIEAEHLMPGDLYSDKDQEYWNEAVSEVSEEFATGIMVRLITGIPASLMGTTVFKLSLMSNHQDHSPKLTFRMDPNVLPGWNSLDDKGD